MNHLSSSGPPSSPWLGSLWSLRREEKVVIGEVRAVSGDLLTLAVVGLDKDDPIDVTRLPSMNEGGQLVHVSVESLIKRWQRMGTSRRASWQRYRPIR